MKQTEIYVKSSLDNSNEPSIFYRSTSNEKRPLLVGLHTWSYNRFNQIDNMLSYAEKYDFNLLLPEFRGENLDTNKNCTYACGSMYAKQDIKDAIDYVVKNENVDKDNIFLIGLSGGGHMALLMAGFCPEYFKAIASYVPICNLEKWIYENDTYKKHVLACCKNDLVEMKKRSPISYIDVIQKANLKIFHGKFDNVVPVTQSLSLYDKIMKKYPKSRVFLDIFDGGHEIDMEEAMYWILSQYKKTEKIQVTG
ncbi:MAG: hypothetical protein E7391_03605 [Ruminococcaceae bacterium]|nr:hypothetical protein [Oscillospiraceae bacterium]